MFDRATASAAGFSADLEDAEVEDRDHLLRVAHHVAVERVAVLGVELADVLRIDVQVVGVVVLGLPEQLRVQRVLGPRRHVSGFVHIV